MCICHLWARQVDGDGRITYVCARCPARVNWTDARRASEILGLVPARLAVVGGDQTGQGTAGAHDHGRAGMALAERS